MKGHEHRLQYGVNILKEKMWCSSLDTVTSQVFNIGMVTPGCTGFLLDQVSVKRKYWFYKSAAKQGEKLQETYK